VIVVALAVAAGVTDVQRPRGPRARPAVSASEEGLRFRLSESEEAPAAPRVPVAAAVPLSDADIARVLARLPPLAVNPEEEQTFALRESSPPPPRTGRTVKDAFPPTPRPNEAPVRVDAGPLTLLRRSPEGDVPLAPNLSVTFSQPVVAVTSQEDAARVRPVRLSPEPPGHWRWIGTKTLLFEPEPRFPMATDYRVTIAAGTPSAAGARLARSEEWTFRTPAPTLKASHPVGGPARRDTLVFAAFDQKIEPPAVLPTIHVRAGNAAPSLRLATDEEIAADETVRDLAAQSERGRFLVLRPSQPLPADTEVVVTVGPGTPSAEGPRTTAKPQEWRFRTYGPLAVKEHRCGWQQGQCPPMAPWQVTFSNPIDAKAFRKEMVTVEPPLSGLKAEVYGAMLMIRGAARGRTSYRVTLAASVPDTFGQTLGREETLSFDVTSAPAALAAPGGMFVVLDPAAPPRFTVFSTNHAALSVSATAVTPEDWPAFQQYLRSAWGNPADNAPARTDPPGRRVLTTTVPVKADMDEPAVVSIDLSPALADGKGQLVVVVEPAGATDRSGTAVSGGAATPAPPARRMPRTGAGQAQRVVAWVQATGIGLDAFVDGESLLGWASALSDGRPLQDVTLSLLPAGASATTAANGTATLPLSASAAAVLVARKDGDVAILPANAGPWGERGWARRADTDVLRWYVADDRGLYRPGEEVKVKGWVRVIGAGKHGDLRALEPSVKTASWRLRDTQGNEIAKGTRPLDAHGGFDVSVKLPANMNLGPALLELETAAQHLAETAHVHSFEVQEFRRPEFEVKASASDGPHVVGARVTVSVAASYFAGGALPDADVTWQVTATPASFTPPGRDDFVFGRWTPWWRPSFDPTPPRNETLTGRTDASGTHRLAIDFESVSPARPTTVRAEATITDVNRQAWTAEASLLVHPSAVYVGLKAPRLFVQKGEPLVAETIAVDLDGKTVGGKRVSVRADRLDWGQDAGEWKETVADTQECDVSSAAEAVRCTFATREGGTYRLTASVTDDAGRPNETEMRLWVAGDAVPPRRAIAQEELTLVPDRKEYRPGETARVLVLAPFAGAEGVLTLRRSGIVKSERFTITGSFHTIEVPIDETWTPNVHVQVDLVGNAPREEGQGGAAAVPGRPAFATGSLDLAVPPRARALDVRVAPRAKALSPGETTVLDLELRDAAQQAVADGDVCVVVVDEAVLALGGYRLPDPLGVFYSPRDAGTEDHHLRSSVQLERIEDLGGPGFQAGRAGEPQALAIASDMLAPAPAARAAVAMKAAGAGPAAPPPIRMRTDFSALALFAASVPTDAAGRAEVTVKLPDNLTRYRVMAVAVAGAKQFGLGESTLTARLPVMVRPSLPRFLNFGDRFELPVVVQNQTDQPLAVDVAVRAANGDLTAGAGRRLTVAANDRAEVRFPTAARRAGTARFQVAATAAAGADASESALPVWTPATTEAFATYGEIDQGAIGQPVRAPQAVVPDFGGLEVTTSSTALQALTDAVLYLTSYPFECAEQISSRVLATAALKDVLGAFEAKGLPEPEAMKAAVDRDLQALKALQNPDGGFAFWRRGDPSWPYVSIHVAHALARAKEKGFAVPADTLDRSRQYLRDVEKLIPAEYGEEARKTLVAYALYTRQRLGDADLARARRLVAEGGVDKLSFEALGFVMPVLRGKPEAAADLEAIRAHLRNRVTETAATAHFVVSYGDDGPLLLHSDRRADAIVLEALIGDQPGNDLVPKLVEGLLGHRRAGRWENTQENVFVLLALDRYFATYEKTTPDFVARAWLGDAYAGEHAFRGRTTERHHVEVPMRTLMTEGGSRDLVVAKEGQGRLYYRIGLRYAPASLELSPADYGFAVERDYEAVDDAKDVRRDASGVWRIRSGARVRVRLRMVAPARRYHVALVDPLPAGLEALNPALKTTGAVPPGPPDVVGLVGAPGLGAPGRAGVWSSWIRPWFEHQNLRDERAEAFTSLLFEGVYAYSYVARATTPGTFVVPPPKAEEMYHPETFGRGATDRVIVE
jgi:alpha-2-macroglobulin